MVLREDNRSEPQESKTEEQRSQADTQAEEQNQIKAEEAEVAKKEDFDPETADRDALLEKYWELESQLREAEERLLRTAADAENFKKRLQREKEEQTRYANEALMRELVPVIDNLERALQHSETRSNQEGLLEGLNMTLKGFIDTLARFGCTAVEAVGKPFDPKFHEAVSQEESAEFEPNTVVRELQKGYVLKERLLRPAMVVVTKPASPQQMAMQNQEAAETEKANNGEVRIKIKKA